MCGAFLSRNEANLRHGLRRYQTKGTLPAELRVYVPADITFRYVVGLLKSVPQLEQLIVKETRDSLELSSGAIIEVIRANIFFTLREARCDLGRVSAIPRQA